MATQYDAEVCKSLEQKFRNTYLYRPMRISQYEAGTELSYYVTDLEQGAVARVGLQIEKFVGGGFAGQVYRVKILKVESQAQIDSIQVGQICAMKILIPPSKFSLLFRNALYWVGFQGPFQLQVNPAAARAGALWQKFIRQAAKIRFGSKAAVVDIYATFVDDRLGSCGELSEWVDGRTWQLEVDDRMDLLSKCKKNGLAKGEKLGSPEYRAKRHFMSQFVKLLHDVGAYEFARQYEWSTCKSQPNCLKRSETENDPSAGLVAVDFRAGLALLPFLPMSPGDFKLIVSGIMRGSFVQFDRGNMNKLEKFIEANQKAFADMPQRKRMIDELKINEKIYRNSTPDVTHNGIERLRSKELWTTIFDSTVTGWRVRNIIDNKSEKKLRANPRMSALFFIIGMIPFLGKLIRRIWARSDWRRHYYDILKSPVYFKRTIEARMAETVIVWHRKGRVDADASLAVANSLVLFLLHKPFSILPAGLHRFMTDLSYAKSRLAYYIVRPIRLYFDASLREQWLKDMVTEGQKKHILSDEDSKVILSQVNEPFIQKYLKSLAVHVCTLPVTQIVSITIAAIYYFTHRDNPNAWAVGLGIIGLFQVVPISPGSLVRGFYVVYLVVKERNFKDYNIAVFLGFFKYIGYLAFPIQMAYHYPALARFMAGHWATEAVHIVPVFGERGALLEHWVFSLFYNWPLTIRRRMRKRAERRALMPARYWHIPLYIAGAAGIFAVIDMSYCEAAARMPSLTNIWPLAILLPFLCGWGVTTAAGGLILWKRIVAASISGMLIGVLYTIATVMTCQANGFTPGQIISGCIWRMFVFTIITTASAIITELRLPEPDRS
ncbi:MAG: hypothetical protein ACYST9_01680 [Planctomycetota bacterium]|jgi:hypothetical protein